MTVWDLVAAERGALAVDLKGLNHAAWAIESLCAGWSIRDVLAHLTAIARMSKPGFVLRLAVAGGSLATMSGPCIRANLGTSPQDTLTRFRAIQTSTACPPGPSICWLGEVLIHAEDIRRPLGLRRDYPPSAVRAVLTHYMGTDHVLGSRTRVAGLRLIATDSDFTHGSGEEVRGPMMSLLLAATGREAGCDDLTGPGVAVLRGRCG